MGDLIARVSVWVLLIVSVSSALLYLPRVRRHAEDKARWALFGLLLSLGLTNLPVLFALHGHSLPFWGGTAVRVLAAVVLVVVVMPLIQDSINELRVWVRVARDSWRLLRDDDR